MLDDGVGDRQTQTRTFVGFFGSEKRSEDSVVMVWWNAETVVGYADYDSAGFLLAYQVNAFAAVVGAVVERISGIGQKI
jgi:hypothetical protein